MKIGDKFKNGRTEYTVIATVFDDGKELYVTKTNKCYTSYSIFCYTQDGEKLYKHS